MARSGSMCELQANVGRIFGVRAAAFGRSGARTLSAVAVVLTACRPATGPTSLGRNDPTSIIRNDGTVPTCEALARAGRKERPLDGGLFVEGACFTYAATLRTQVSDDSLPPKVSVRSSTVRCHVSLVKRFTSATAAALECSKPKASDDRGLTKTPQASPAMAPERIYVAVAKGLWWTETMPTSDREVSELTKDPLKQLLASPPAELYEKNVEDEDVSFTAQVENNAAGEWCWQHTERDDEAIINKLCFADGALVRAERTHEEDGNLEQATFELVR